MAVLTKLNKPSRFRVTVALTTLMNYKYVTSLVADLRSYTKFIPGTHIGLETDSL